MAKNYKIVVLMAEGSDILEAKEYFEKGGEEALMGFLLSDWNPGDEYLDDYNPDESYHGVELETDILRIEKVYKENKDTYYGKYSSKVFRQGDYVLIHNIGSDYLELYKAVETP